MGSGLGKHDPGRPQLLLAELSRQPITVFVLNGRLAGSGVVI
jgi:hypothetical protein